MLKDQLNNFLKTFDEYNVKKSRASKYEIEKNFLSNLEDINNEILKLVENQKLLSLMENFNIDELLIDKEIYLEIKVNVGKEIFNYDVLKKLKKRIDKYNEYLKNKIINYKLEILSPKIEIANILIELIIDKKNEIEKARNTIERFNINNLDIDKINNYKKNIRYIDNLFTEISLNDNEKNFIKKASGDGFPFSGIDGSLESWISRNKFGDRFVIRIR